jgi:hypothetical protein
VRAPDGIVLIDPTGRLAGRGAYLCRNAACWDVAGRKRALEHALKTTIPADVAAALASGPDALVTTAPIVDPKHRVTGAHTLAAPSASPATQGGAHGQE